MADMRNDSASPMDGQPGKSSNLEESSISQKSPVKMKVDAPEEEQSSDKEENKSPYSPSSHSFASSRPVFGGSGKLGSSVLASPRLGGATFGSNPFAAKTLSSPKLNSGTSSSFGSLFSPRPVLLRPSQLAVGGGESPSQTTPSSTFPLKSSALGNPFTRVVPVSEDNKDNKLAKDEGKPEEIKACDAESSRSIGSTEENDKAALEQNLKPAEGSSNTSSNCASPFSSRGILGPPKFVPLGTPSRPTEESGSKTGAISTPSTTTAAAATSSSTSSPAVTGFVFGQNLHERVAEAVTSESSDVSSRSSEAAGTSKNSSNLSAAATTNGTSEMLFTSVIKKDHISESNHSSSNSTGESTEKPSKSLSEAAREYEEARAVKRKYDEVQIITGEEDEANVLQVNCKLFAFDKASGTWVERGRGTLRLNDKDGGPGCGMQSRVVIRTTGSLRVVLNTKIWAGMSVDRPSPKSVRLTAMDNTGQIKVFLVMSSPKETEQLHKCLEMRVQLAQRASQNQTKSEGGLASHSLPPEPCSKKRLSEDSSPTPDVTSV